MQFLTIWYTCGMRVIAIIVFFAGAFSVHPGPVLPTPLTNSMYYLYDTSPGAMTHTPKDIALRRDWKLTTRYMNPPGFSNGATLWFKTAVAPANAGTPSLFIPHVVGALTVFRGSNEVYRFEPFSSGGLRWDIPPFYVIPVTPGVTDTYYLRIYSPSTFAGIRLPPVLLPDADVGSFVIARDAGRLILFGLFMSISIVAFVFFIARRIGYEYIGIGLFTFSLAVYTLYWTEIKALIFPNALHVVMGAWFITFQVIPASILFFVERLFGERYRLFLRILLAAVVAYAVAIPVLVFSNTVFVLHATVAGNIVTYAVSFVIIAVVGREALRKNPEAIIFVCGALFLILLSGRDMLATLRVLPSGTILAPWGTLGFVAALVVLLAYRFVLVYRNVKAYAREIEDSHGKIESQLENFLLVLASAIESKDKYTGGHVERVGGYAREIARKLKFRENELRDLYLGAIVHDIGKIGVRDAVLNKPGRLDPDEMTHMQEHTTVGKRLLDRIRDIRIASDIAYCHQERWDGQGYPQGISGEAIPLAARIVTIADYWDAIITDRPYRKAMHAGRALAIMREERGKAFDPALYDIFMDENDKLYQQYLSPEKVAELDEVSADEQQ